MFTVIRENLIRTEEKVTHKWAMIVRCGRNFGRFDPSSNESRGQRVKFLPSSNIRYQVCLVSPRSAHLCHSDPPSYLSVKCWWSTLCFSRCISVICAYYRGSDTSRWVTHPARWGAGMKKSMIPASLLHTNGRSADHMDGNLKSHLCFTFTTAHTLNNV